MSRLLPNLLIGDSRVVRSFDAYGSSKASEILSIYPAQLRCGQGKGISAGQKYREEAGLKKLTLALRLSELFQTSLSFLYACSASLLGRLCTSCDSCVRLLATS